ncbi:MAG: hypothetical protein ABWZ02_08660 [Nakamurella sp.]
MFGLSWGQIAIIVLVGVFVLGPERIPTAVNWVITSLRKVRTMAAGAQAELRREIGPEIDELRRQVADLQSLKEIQELRDLRDLHPKRLIGKNILGDEFSGGITGFLGLNEQPSKPSAPGPGAVSLAKPGATDGAAPTNGAAPANGVVPANGAAPANGAVPANGAAPTNGAPAAFSGLPAPNAVRPASPSVTKLAPPRVVGQFTPRAPKPEPSTLERPPFDPDGT